MSFSELADQVLVACRDTFGETVSYTPQSTGEPEAIVAVFESAHEEIVVPVDSGIPISTRQPILGLRLADLTVAPRKGDTVLAQSVTYTVADVLPDGWGGATLRLSR